MGKMIFYHALPTFILRGHDYNISVAIPNVDFDNVNLFWSTDMSGGELLLEKNHCYTHNDCCLTVYSAVLPFDVFEKAYSLSYRFSCNDFESEEYCVKIDSAGKMPPLIVTELYLRPLGLNVTQFIEVLNPSESTVDLYDYKLMAYRGKNPSPSDYISSLFLSNSPGENLVSPYEVVALWPLLSNHHESADGFYLTVDGFADACMADFPKPEFDVCAEKSNVRIIPIEASDYDGERDKYIDVNNTSKWPKKDECTTLVLARRDTLSEAGLDEAAYLMVYNECKYGNRDTPVRHSSLWTIDVRVPSVGVVVSHRERISPGRLGFGQAIPYLTLPYPMISPVNNYDAFLSSDGIVLKFIVCGQQIASVCIDVKMDNGEYRRYRAAEADDGTWQIHLKLKDIYRLNEIAYVATVFDGVHTVAIGTTQCPMSIKLADRCGPYIISTSPAELYGYDNTRIPRICVEYFDISGVDIENSILCVDGKNISSLAIWHHNKVVYVPSKDMKYGKHNFEIMLRDKLGNKTYRKVNFSICNPDDLNLYCGEVHCHTAFSDGTATPEEAYSYARDVGGVDFFAVTEHSNYSSEDLYLQQCDIADSYNSPGEFAALYGYEMTWNNRSGLWGHLNVLNSKEFYNDINSISLPEFYDILKLDKNVVGMFNHPCLHWGNFHNFTAYSDSADRFMCLAEIKGAGFDREYANMLALGWHASPAFNEDNHGYNWTTASSSTTYALAPALTRENIIDAFRRRRTYSTSDSTMKIKFRINGEWMGGKLYDPAVLDINVDIITQNESGIGNISIVTEDNIVVASVNVGALQEYHWSLKLAPDFDYYYIKVMSAGKYSVTAPVWIEAVNVLSVKSLECSCNALDYKSNEVSVKVKNLSSRNITSVCVDFYLTSDYGFDLERAVPYRKVIIPELKANKTACIKCNAPNVSGMRRISAVVKGNVGKKQYADTAMILLSPVKIVEILPKSSEMVDRNGNVITNPFPYFKLCNLSNRDICLDKYYTRLWTSTGKQPSEERIFRFNKHVIKAGGILTVWVMPKECDLDVKDFNEHYGVEMVEGDNLISTRVRAISASKNSTRRLDLMCDKELMSRVEYNFVQPPQSDVNEGKAIVYDTAPNMMGTSKIANNSSEPCPDKLI